MLAGVLAAVLAAPAPAPTPPVADAAWMVSAPSGAALEAHGSPWLAWVAWSLPELAPGTWGVVSGPRDGFNLFAADSRARVGLDEGAPVALFAQVPGGPRYFAARVASEAACAELAARLHGPRAPVARRAGWCAFPASPCPDCRAPRLRNVPARRVPLRQGVQVMVSASQLAAWVPRRLAAGAWWSGTAWVDAGGLHVTGEGGPGPHDETASSFGELSPPLREGVTLTATGRLDARFFRDLAGPGAQEAARACSERPMAIRADWFGVDRPGTGQPPLAWMAHGVALARCRDEASAVRAARMAETELRRQMAVPAGVLVSGNTGAVAWLAADAVAADAAPPGEAGADDPLLVVVAHGARLAAALSSLPVEVMSHPVMGPLGGVQVLAGPSLQRAGLITLQVQRRGRASAAVSATVELPPR